MQCPDCKGCGKFGGPGSYYDRPGGKPCWTCDGDGVVVVETTEVDPKQAVGRLLPEGWRVERTFAYDGGTWLHGDWCSFTGYYARSERVPHGELVEVVIEDTPADDAPLYGTTIQQPYASLIAHGIKTIETRGYQPRVVKPGDDLAIIAGAKRPEPGWLGDRYDYSVGYSTVGPAQHLDECECDDPDDGQWSEACSALNEWEPTLASNEGAHGYSVVTQLPLGAVVAVARFVEALPITDKMPPLQGEPWEILHNGVFLNRNYWPGYGGVQTHRGERYDDQRPLGDFRPGRFGWLLDNVRRLPEPVPCTGFQGLRALPDDVTAAVRQAVQ